MKEIKEILELIDELETTLRYRRNIVVAAREIEKDYQAKRYSYFEYEQKLNHVLKGKKLKDWVDYYNAYALNLLERIKLLNTNIFYFIYHDTRAEDRLKEATLSWHAGKIAEVHKQELIKPEPKLSEPIFKKKVPAVQKPQPVMEIPKQVMEVPKPVIEKKTETAGITKKAKHEQEPSIRIERKAPEIKPELPAFRKKKHEVIEPKHIPTTEVEHVPQEITSEPAAEEIESLRKKIEKPEAPDVEAEQIKKRAQLFEKKAKAEKKAEEYYTMYIPSALGTAGNRYFRHLGEFVIRKYPESFESLFKAMRYANIKILSKTYVNIILLISVLAFVSSFLIFVLIGFFSLNLYTILIRPLVVSVLVSFLAFGITYGYPFIKSDQRARTIDANLPFAINHMSAVATSGLPPDMMFRIVAQSREYKEIGIELRKLVEYIDLFGYDLTTAMQSVSAITPSRDFKEFLDGALATLTSGGDFGLFLKEKSEQTMFAYRLRMEKYNETVSTYSDVYMGIMIVAPVFFIAILSLVSILGGTIFGLDIQTVIVFGTYVIIPFLNIAFITFLEVSQPIE